MKIHAVFLALISFAYSLALPAQAQDTKPVPDREELRLQLNSDGSHYIKATFLNQVWLRYNASNPGTLVLGDPTTTTTDIGLRRTRFQLFGQLTDHVFFYFQLGQNNFNYLAGQNATNTGNRKYQFFIHDALTEYRVRKNSDLMHLGMGLTISNGLSRFSQPSIGTIATMDVPIFAQATVDATDEFSRKLSLYARGQLGKLDYRLILSDPFPVTSNGNVQLPIHPLNSTFAYNRHRKQYQGLAIWNFGDKEPHTTPYMTGTYLGKRRILNFEAGFIHQQDALWSGDIANPDYHDLNLWSTAFFYDAPGRHPGSAVNAYVGYFSTDYGKGYLRYNGIMNPANGTSVAGAPSGSQGNAFPMFGTGSVFYSQFGYLLGHDVLGEGNGQLMPYVSWQHAEYDRLTESMDVYHAGVNWLIKGHSSKLTLDFQSRPWLAVEGNAVVPGGRRSQILLQYQVFF